MVPVGWMLSPVLTGSAVERCPLDVEQPLYWNAPRGSEVRADSIAFAADQAPFVSWYPIPGEEGWTRWGQEPQRLRVPGADRVDGTIRLWSDADGCETTATGCSEHHSWYVQPRVYAAFPESHDACVAADVALAQGRVVVLGNELVALRHDGRVVGRYGLPARVARVVHDDHGVVVTTADGSLSMLRWTTAGPDYGRLAVKGPVYEVDGDVLIAEGEVVGLDADLGVRWRLDARPYATLRTDDGLWVVTGTTSSRLVLLDPAHGTVLRAWTVAPGPPHAAELVRFTSDPANPGTTAGLTLHWLERDRPRALGLELIRLGGHPP